MESRMLEEDLVIDIKYVIDVFRRYWAIIVIVPVLSVLVATAFVRFGSVPLYRAEASVLLRESVSMQPLTSGGARSTRQLVLTASEIARSRVVAQTAVETLNADLTAQQIRDMINVSLRGEAEMIFIAVTNQDPQKAADVTNAIAESFLFHAARVLGVEHITVVDSAVVPDTPVNVRGIQFFVIVATASLFAGIALAFCLGFVQNALRELRNTD